MIFSCCHPRESGVQGNRRAATLDPRFRGGTVNILKIHMNLASLACWLGTVALDAAGALAYNRASLGAAAAPLSFFL
jgi:hypothetical protein